ncbi:molecular chaperone [Ignatzschineria rhizosphaerae]|uniref:Molecular chaperone n=1 Tax=Ignatzschineria rhizosphaerae TaxID=2923279 RepID=A0ABY3X3J4_9GAMM|nr:fimbria/pilus periplasmic chaperone [Ignatzschineria rhizosphaerae]UNM97452.1 molecular chaperone [Ignatzschineria rhizosphaerae]
MMMKKTVLFLAGLLLNDAYGQLNFERSRIIFDAGQKNSQSLVVSNISADTPYLAQTWIENDRGEKVITPLAALPILQRINPKQEKQIKISFIGSGAELAPDRESLFFINILGLPPKGKESQSTVSIVIQSKIKVFYRPKGLPAYMLEIGGLFTLQC